jgi:DNA-binding transcriptional regulator YiaG/tetratricopeptide (TPR) repeat protein
MATDVVSLREYARRRRNTAEPAEGRTLQAFRRRAGLSQHEFAAALAHELGINIRPGAVRAWEEGHTTPPPEILAVAKRLPTLPGTPDLASDTDSELQSGLNGGRIGADIISWASKQVAALSRLDDQVGGARVLPLATGSLELLTQLISQARYSDAHATELRRTVAEVARLAGWVAFDAGHTDKANRYWRTAITAAREANDQDYGAYAMAFLAFHAIDTQRDPAAALKLLQAAEHQATRSAPLRIVLAQWSVQPYGLLGESREAQRSLTRADSLWERRNPEDDPPWLYWMYLPSLSPEVPRGIIPGNPRRAEAMFIDGLDALSDEYPRDRTLFCLGIAEARLAQNGRLDEAIDAARSAISLASSAPSPRVRERLRRLIRSLPAHPSTAELRENLTGARAQPT